MKTQIQIQLEQADVETKHHLCDHFNLSPVDLFIFEAGIFKPDNVLEEHMIDFLHLNRVFAEMQKEKESVNVLRFAR